VHLRKTFPQAKKNKAKQPDKVAVNDLSLAIDGQGCFAMLGPNGAGKTTTLSMLTGDIRPTGTEIYIYTYIYIYIYTYIYIERNIYIYIYIYVFLKVFYLFRLIWPKRSREDNHALYAHWRSAPYR